MTHVLSLLFPTSITVPLSLDLLNETSFVPESKNEDLHSGMLQVPGGTTLLLTENNVQEGKLVERGECLSLGSNANKIQFSMLIASFLAPGVINVMAIQNAMVSQTLSYRFPFSDFSFPTDLSFIVLTEAKKSAFLKVSQVLYSRV